MHINILRDLEAKMWNYKEAQETKVWFRRAIVF